MALTTATATAYRTASRAEPEGPAAQVVGVPVMEAPAAVVQVAEGLTEACPRVVVASTGRGEHSSVARAGPCTRAWFILASGIWRARRVERAKDGCEIWLFDGW